MKKKIFVAFAAVTVFVSTYLSAKAAPPPPPSCEYTPNTVCTRVKSGGQWYDVYGFRTLPNL